MHNTVNQATAKKKSNPLVDILISILIPSIILMKMSGEDRLGPTTALIVALAFPIGYGLYDLIVNGNRNVMAVSYTHLTLPTIYSV